MGAPERSAVIIRCERRWTGSADCSSTSTGTDLGMATPPPERRQSLCMATAEDRRVRLQGYADAKTIDRALRNGARPRRWLAAIVGRVRPTR
jgi:hypothetical protein